MTADLVIPESQWDGVTPADFKAYLAAGVLDALQAMCAHLAKRKIEVDAALLMNDASRAVAAFLAEP